MDKLYIIIPAYNEEKNIKDLIDDWYPVIEAHDGGGDSRLVVVDDGSRDETHHLLEKLAVSRPLLRTLTKPNGGHGSAVLFGYRYALAQGADFIFQTDADRQTDPAEFGQFWEERLRFEAVFGMRPKRGDGRCRAFIEKVLCLLLRLYFGVKIPDSNAPYRLMSAAYLKRYLPRLPRDYHLPNVMLTVFGVYEKRPVRFVEVSFKPRQAGVNSINLWRIAGIGFQALREFAGFRRGMRRM